MLQDPDQSEAFDNWPIRFILNFLKFKYNFKKVISLSPFFYIVTLHLEDVLAKYRDVVVLY